MTTTELRKLADQTPLEIDTALAALYQELAKAESRVDSYIAAVHYAVSDRREYRYGWKLSDAEARDKAEVAAATDQTYVGSQARDALTNLEAAEAAVAYVERKMGPLDAEFVRRGGWTRAFLVQNNNGHVHKWRECSTCFATTQFFWVVEFAAKDEAEVIEAAGERACTVCYPNAPVSALARPTRIYGPDEVAAQQAKDERAAAKDKRQADKIAKSLTLDGSEFRLEFTRHGRNDHEWFKTQRAAEIWWVEKVADNKAYNYELPNVEALDTIVEMISAKSGKSIDAVKAELNAKVLAKIKRDSR